MPPPHRILPLLAGIAGAIVFSFVSRAGMSGKSATYDEAVHLLSGYRILTASDHDFNHEHPPLMKALAAAPVVLTGAAKPLEPWTYKRESDEWPLSHDWLYHANDGDRLLSLGRLPIVTLGACLALLVFVVAWKMAGERAGVIAASVAVLLFSLEPNLLAHGSLITTDMGMTVFFFATVAAFWRFIESRGAGWLALTGLLWGLGLLAKFTSVLACPSLIAMGAAQILVTPKAAAGTGAGPRRNPVKRKETTSKGRAKGGDADPKPKEAGAPSGESSWSVWDGVRRIWAQPITWGERAGGRWLNLVIVVALAGAIALLVLNAGYGFDRSFQSLSKMKLESESFRARAKGPLGSIPLPVPAPFVQGYDHAEAGGQRWWSYLMGQHSMTGWPYYYLLAIFVKTPIPILILAAAGLILWRRVEGLQGRDLHLLAIPPALLMLFFTLSGNLKNIGLRYVLPLYPFFCLLGGIGAAALWRSWRWYGRAALAVLLVWFVVGAVIIYPDHLAYFNEIAGGPEGGRFWLLDSNLDWGQDLKGLGAWMREHGVSTIFLDYFGRACPRYYGVRTARDFEGGWIAVSATNLAGVYRDDKLRYDFLKGVRPVASIGHSILVYDVPRPPGWTPVPGGTLE